MAGKRAAHLAYAEVRQVRMQRLPHPQNKLLELLEHANINLFSKTMMWVDYVTVDKRTL